MSSDQVILAKGRPVNITTVDSRNNYSNTPLSSSQSFIGGFESVSNFTSAVISTLADQDGTLYIDMSFDGQSADYTSQYEIKADVYRSVIQLITNRYFRIRFVNGSSAQSSFNVNVIYGNHTQPPYPLANQSFEEIFGKTFLDISTVSTPLASRIDEVSSSITYVGKAPIGSLSSESVWQIQRLTVSGSLTIIEFADGDGRSNNVWDNRASLSYS